MKQNKMLLHQAKECQRDIDNFRTHLLKKYPDLNLGTCGSIEYNNWTIQMDKVLAEQVHPKRYDKFLEHSIY
jgi:hypothetical protein